MSNCKDLIDPALNSITNGSESALTFKYFWLVNDSSFTFKLKFNFEELWLVHFLWVDLLIQVIKSKHYTFANSINYNRINVFSIFFPLGFLFIEFDSIIDLFEQFVNSSTTVFYSQKFICNSSFKNIIVLLRRNRLVFAINHRLFKFGKFSIDTIQWFFHLIHNLVKIVYCFLCLLDKVINSSRLPFELFDTRLYILVHFYNSFLHQRLLNIIQAGNNSIVILNDQFERNNLSSVNISLLE